MASSEGNSLIQHAGSSIIIPGKQDQALRLDGWANLFTGLGVQSRDKRLSTEFGGQTVLSRDILDELYHGDDVIARICDRPADEMTRQWIRLNHDGDADAGKAVMQKLDDLDAQAKLAEAVTWSRLYGGAVIILGAEDGGDSSQPLNEANIQTFEWLNVLDRWDLQVSHVNGDLAARGFGEPERYRIVSDLYGADGLPFGAEIHASRVIHVDGVRTNRRERRRNQGWGRSLIERVYPVVRDFAAAFGGMSHLLQDFAQAVFTMKGLNLLIASDQENVVLQRMALMDMARSVARAIPLDENEKFERHATPVAGLPELLDRMGERLSAATEMPMTLLMGRSPAGMNATGESDLRLWYDYLKGVQIATLRKPINRLLKLTMLAKRGPLRGRELQNWSFDFCPMWQMSDAQIAELRNKQSLTDTAYVNMGALDPTEVRKSRFGGDVWSAETQLDPTLEKAAGLLAEAQQEPEEPAEEEF